MSGSIRMPLAGPRRRRLSVWAVVLLILSFGLAGIDSMPASAAPHGQGHAARAAHGGGARVTAAVSDKPRQYTAEELAQLNSRLYDEDSMDKGKAGPKPRHAPLGTAVAQPSSVRSFATTVRDSAIPTSGISGGASYLSSTQEPSTDANGSNIFQTGNWYATRSIDNGATWSYLDPYTLFGSGFCCDQVTQYDPATGRQFWLLQFSDHLVIANASASGSGAYTGWCYWNITPSWMGLANTTALDFNDMSISNSNVNISTNFFPSSGGSGAGLLRLPKSPMSTCSGFGYSYLTRTDNLTFKLVPGSTDTLYWGSNWGQTNGSSFRVFAWPESSGNYSWWDRTVPSYGFYTRNSGQNCASTDGVVTNWCQYADSRVLGAYRAGGLIGFSFNAKQDGSHPFPYTRFVWFNESDKNLNGSGDLWGSWGAIQFASLAPNSLGRVGLEFAWGGGTGGAHYYPGSGINSQPANAIDTNPNYYLWGAGNTCTYAGLPRWGDYLTVRTYKADPTRWVAAGYAMKGGNCGATGAYPEPHNVLFS
ncbi:hypothetical protein [Streptomyces sp. NPDC001410]|uniref:hypothetical protein n=1 Tax=Streptomyces sp. NPDC001410 TaxID=3364574 RepID=UPI0036AEEB57